VLPLVERAWGRAVSTDARGPLRATAPSVPVVAMLDRVFVEHGAHGVRTIVATARALLADEPR
jgi:hypothetical protein